MRQFSATRLIAILCGLCHAAAAAAQTAPGRVEAASTLALGTAATGVIAEVAVQEGDRVRAGQLLVRVDCQSTEKELAARTHGLAAAEAALARAVHGPRAEEVAIAVANVGFAEARADEAGIVLRRGLALQEGITISKAQLDQSKRDARITAAQLDEARARLALLRAGTRREDIDEAQARRDGARALAEEAAARLRYCSVEAPSDGVVLSVHVAPGQLVSTAIPVTLLRLADDARRRIRAEVDERDSLRLCRDQRAVVTADSVPGTQVAAVVEAVAAEVSRSGERDVRVARLRPTEASFTWPLGLRVAVRFSPCP